MQLQLITNMIFIENVNEKWLHPLMDDNIVVFVTTMKVFAIAIVYPTTCTNKHRLHMANFAISIGLLSLQCTHPWVFHDIIFNSL